MMHIEIIDINSTNERVKIVGSPESVLREIKERANEDIKNISLEEYVEQIKDNVYLADYWKSFIESINASGNKYFVCIMHMAKGDLGETSSIRIKNIQINNTNIDSEKIEELDKQYEEIKEQDLMDNPLDEDQNIFE